MEQKTLQIGLYEHSLAEADRTNELELWLYSKMENQRCKEALEQLVTEQPDAASLDSEQGQNLLREFGIDRMMWVLAFSLYQKPFEATMQPWSWADGVVPRDYPMDEAQDWTITEHIPQLVRMAEQFEKLYTRLGMLDERYCLKALDNQDVSGKLLIVNPRTLADEVKRPHFQLFYAKEAPENSDRIKGVNLADGQELSMKRISFLGVADETMMPQWAEERLEQLRSPQNMEQDMADETIAIEAIAG